MNIVRARKPLSEHEPEQDSAVHLIEQPARAPSNQLEHLIVSILRAKGTVPFDSLVRQAAAELYREEMRNGAGVLDIGLFGSSLFAGEVAAEVRARDGVLWQIDKQTGLHP
jgi:hypothetical protein